MITVCSTESEVMTRVGLGVDRARPSSTESVGPHRTHLVERVSTQLVKTKSIIGLTYIHNNNAFANPLPTRNSQVRRLAAQKQNQNKPPIPKKPKNRTTKTKPAELVFAAVAIFTCLHKQVKFRNRPKNRAQNRLSSVEVSPKQGIPE